MYGLTVEQKSIVESARSIAKDDIAPHAELTDEEGRYPAESMQALRREGFLGLLVPGEQGGMGQDLRVMAAVIEEIARACSSTALCFLVHLAGGATYAASNPPKEDLLQAVARGEHVSTLALGEFGS
ncbi:MAG: acyl-CoA dehydrogenase, partial [Anaerolineae bacterium]|nr:acyl-CoA dehydrogenase [Anaerolineae bacterium]